MAEKAKKTPSAPKKKKVVSKTTKSAPSKKAAVPKKTKLPVSDKEVDLRKLEDEKRISELEYKLESMEKKEASATQRPPRPVQTVYKQNGGGTAKFLAALFAVLFIGAAASAVYFYNESTLNADCETNYKGLLSDYTELSTLYDVLSAEKTSLELDVSTLTLEKAALSSEIDDLENDGITKDVQITTLEAQIAELDEEIDNKEGRITYLEIMLDSCKDRNEELEDSLTTCQDGQDELEAIVLHPCIGSYWTSNPDTDPAEIEFIDDQAVEYFYLYLCVACTDCYSVCDPCDPCDPCADLCGGTSCCCNDGPFDAIRLKVRVTTTYDSVSDKYTQSIEIVSWKWV